MWIGKDREVVETSLYNIPERLKEIDPQFFVVRNHKTMAWEIHHSGQIGSTLALNVPYAELDARVLYLVRKNSIERAQQVIDEIDKHNQYLEDSALKKAMDDTAMRMKDIHRYVAQKGVTETIPEDASVIRDAYRERE